MAQYAKTESIGSIASIILAILEVQVDAGIGIDVDMDVDSAMGHGLFLQTRTPQKRKSKVLFQFPKGLRYLTIGYLWFRYWDSELWFWVGTLQLGTWTLRVFLR